MHWKVKKFLFILLEIQNKFKLQNNNLFRIFAGSRDDHKQIIVMDIFTLK